jgi:hypothetical protein
LRQDRLDVLANILPVAKAIQGTHPMRLLRSNIGRIVWLALFALACQSVLSFGHVHLGKPNLGLAWAGVVDAGTAADNAPSTPNPVGTADEFCVICANISLAGVLLIPVVLALLAPVQLNAKLPWPRADITPASVSRLLLRARGPPASPAIGLSRRFPI